jgi:hypothetical protein
MIDDNSRVHIAREVEQLKIRYSALTKARGDLRQWEEGKDYSILGIVELISDYAIGAASQVAQNGTVVNCEKALRYLKGIRPFGLAYVRDWYLEGDAAFDDIKEYLKNIDYLRLQIIEILEIYCQKD